MAEFSREFYDRSVDAREFYDRSVDAAYGRHEAERRKASEELHNTIAELDPNGHWGVVRAVVHSQTEVTVNVAVRGMKFQLFGNDYVDTVRRMTMSMLSLKEELRWGGYEIPPDVYTSYARVRHPMAASAAVRASAMNDAYGAENARQRARTQPLRNLAAAVALPVVVEQVRKWWSEVTGGRGVVRWEALPASVSVRFANDTGPRRPERLLVTLQEGDFSDTRTLQGDFGGALPTAHEVLAWCGHLHNAYARHVLARGPK